MMTDIQADKIREYDKLLSSLTMNNRDEAEQFIRTFKSLVYDFKMIGYLHDYYIEDIKIIRENRDILDGIDAVIKDTTEFLAAFPDMTIDLESIIINGSKEKGYKFFVRSRYRGTNLGYSSFGEPSGKSLGEGCMGLAMFFMKEVDGKWKIYDEMNMISMEHIEKTLSK